MVSLRSQQVDLSFTEPYFLDKNIAAGFDLFEVKTSPTPNFFTGVTPAYQQFSYGGALRAGYQITENLRQTWKYTGRSDDITNVQRNASLFIQLQAGTHTTSAIGQVLLYDQRDNRLEPTRRLLRLARQRFRRRRLWRPVHSQQGQCRLLLFGRAGVGAELHRRGRLHLRLGRPATC